MSQTRSGVIELNHALAAHHLRHLRSVDTSPAGFRQHVNSLATLLAAEATRDLPLQQTAIKTPMETMTAAELKGRVAAVPVLRAGLGMVSPVLALIPEIEVWHLGLYRDEETAQPVTYYDKLPADNPVDTALVLDPMLATGGSATAALTTLSRWGVAEIRMLSIIAAPEGLQLLQNEFPKVTVYTCAVDRELNDRKFILPGLGDAGDRIFNT